jgi:integrase
MIKPLRIEVVGLWHHVILYPEKRAAGTIIRGGATIPSVLTNGRIGKAIGIPLNDDAIRVSRLQLGKHHSHVFTCKGNPVKKAGAAVWKKSFKRAGIENFRWHDLCHTWTSWNVQSGTPLNSLQELGGWNNYEMFLDMHI